jgi:hypothetical protein
MRRAAALAAALLAWGCALLPGGQAERVRLPELPPSWLLRFPGLSCRLEWPWTDGTVRTRSLACWPAEAVVELPRAAPVPILAVPIHAGVELLPAGGVYPPDDPPLALSWSDGPVARCLLRLAAAGCDLSLLNTGRLLREAAALELEDPWHLDSGRLSAAISAGSLRVTDLRASDLRPVRLSLPPGLWIRDCAAAPALASDGSLLLPAAEGFRRLFHSELALRVDLFVSAAAAEARVAAHPF